ncbi:hypothetical protein PENDEC_c037G00467 [Penicillium decumbens]|uniref:Uncharacterized protein n=1 Tax=Penicillium decumbens TaxID=69771 RepID=A0A1V6NRQ1_PENDC|nr:hypothetical protein PENDEC_c037G00467 [Penicillium decumbens]
MEVSINAKKILRGRTTRFGLVHAGRKERGKVDTTVYGIATIVSSSFSTASTIAWCTSMSTWDQIGGENRRIVGLLVQTMKKASEQSPTHTREGTFQTREFSSSAGDDAAMGGM